MVEKQHVYIIGSKGIPAKYGGFETFVEKLTQNQQDRSIQYHVACMTENSAKSGISDKEFSYNGAMCFNVDVPNIGPAKAIYYDIKALEYSIELAKKNKDNQPIFYILACRIGPFISSLKRKITKINGKLFVNPDGHEWLRAKWSYPVRRYWKYSEQLMIKHSDLLICDSKNIEKYIQNDYAKYSPKTTYIAYGTDMERSGLTSSSLEVRDWFDSKKIAEDNYYLVVGRFVPENNYEKIIKGFMQSNSDKDLVLITNVDNKKFSDYLKKKTNFDKDKRVKFVGTVYNQELLKYIRHNSYAYIHGHEVGGTNPSLLESLSATRLNLLLNVGFNHEVAEEGALYWYEPEELSKLIDSKIDTESLNRINDYALNRVKKYFDWDYIVNKYEKLFGKERTCD